jgi:hypothetical protein
LSKPKLTKNCRADEEEEEEEEEEEWQAGESLLYLSPWISMGCFSRFHVGR